MKEDKKNDREEWIDSVMNSLDGMQRAQVNPFLYRKIADKLEKKPALKAYVSPSKLWIATLSFVVLLAINVAAIIKHSRNTTAGVTELLYEHGFTPE